MEISWIRCHSYDDAKEYKQVLYLHEWEGIPFYWGKAEVTKFGGNSREIDGRKWNARYNPGYKHWIEGCLRHGGRLYVGQIRDRGEYSFKDIERHLINKYGSEMNARHQLITRQVEHVVHTGDVPTSISSRERP